ncbi:36.4 kDa proline-rich protein-like isoform X2 [Trachypithecus francoisi]|uniref:36.4 kDa proline-rich protein-like isoform X2 n=1 Tax=Trachypithecus francoisi TaxID=54180 RepID=UPI00141B941A|nr:36.4 kDa proline-rich protein-like isoform X2 [Trachypithecus francoisi]XP_033065524.1 36.4 kDa proline-rich protein-like isoform X2 [Trachypithecus francoisi]XP_033065525.1 36.4 kDa proline-rich protein-like isoform X2 [Trachypithecus francoisi]XP_033065526.1 36.4 kDa proline-rich protein-like isoform X2 [Trachypithecus francoisi]
MCIFQHVELTSEVSQGCRENLGAGIEEAAPRGSQRSPRRNPVGNKKLCERPGSVPTTAGAARPAASLRVQPPTRVLQPTREARAPATRPHPQGPSPPVVVPPHLRPPPPLARPPHRTTPA